MSDDLRLFGIAVGFVYEVARAARDGAGDQTLDALADRLADLLEREFQRGFSFGYGAPELDPEVAGS